MNKSNFCLNAKFDVVLQFHLRLLIICLGVACNLICIIIFVKITRSRTDNTESNFMFRFFLFKSICEFVLCVTEIPIILSLFNNIFSSRYFVIWYIVCYHYIGSVVKLMSPYYEIEASMYCVLLIYRVGDRCCLKSRLFFYLITLSTLLFCTSFYVPTLFFFYIAKIGQNKYQLKFTPLYFSRIGRTLILIHSILRDIQPLILLLILDIFIIIFLKKLTRRRQDMLESNNSTSKTSTSNVMISRSQFAENNKIKMIFFTSLINICHLPIIIRNFQDDILLNVGCFPKIAVLLLDLSYTIPILTYFLFNNNFKRIFLNFFKTN
jgi:hypothetical protein